MRIYLRSRLILGILILFFYDIYSQPLDSLLLKMNSSIELDSLITHVRILSGEDSVVVGNNKVLINNRHDTEKRLLASQYIWENLNRWGYDVEYQVYPTGRNVIAVKKGSTDTTMNVILCAHYDSVTDYCADDNASGVSAVLETARNMKNIDTRFNVIFAFWDEEERNLKGSKYFVANTFLKPTDINAVINLDMIGWDNNNDGKFDIGTTNTTNSFEVGKVAEYIAEKFDFNVIPLIHLPDLLTSDHDAFIFNNYSAILISEGFSTNDFNEYYHSTGDRIEYFNYEYIHALSKVAALSLLYCAANRIHYITELNTYNENDIQNQDEFIINVKLNNTENVDLKVIAVIDSIDSHTIDTLIYMMTELILKNQQEITFGGTNGLLRIRKGTIMSKFLLRTPN